MAFDTHIMKILVVGFYDDNFGDMLIRQSFVQLMMVAMKNLGMGAENYEIEQMHLKRIDEAKVRCADLICFAGGGLFGLSYLNFYEFLKQILDMAEEENIPVLFSSMGINNMDATEENEEKLRQLLQSSAIRSISVRENRELFEYYAGEHTYPITKVCDPAVWAQEIYHEETADIRAEKAQREKPLVGINVVRGGLFDANGKDWKLGDQCRYLQELREALEEAGLDYRFYTNGSFLDNNTMRFFAAEYGVPEEKLIYVHTAGDLVETVALFDVIAAIRMHTAIIAYAFEIPTVNVIWNAKLPLFYANIGHPERCVEVEEWTGQHVFDMLQEVLPLGNAQNPDYMMSVYRNLYEVLGQILPEILGSDEGKSAEDCPADDNVRELPEIRRSDADKCSEEATKEDHGLEKTACYTFSQVVEELHQLHVSVEEEITDLRFKMNKAEKVMLSRFRKNRELTQNLKTAGAEIKGHLKEEQRLQKEVESALKKNEKLTGKLENEKAKLAEQKQKAEEQKKQIEALKKELEKQKKEKAKLQAQVDRFNNFWLVKIYHAVKRTARKLLGKS